MRGRKEGRKHRESKQGTLALNNSYLKKKKKPESGVGRLSKALNFLVTLRVIVGLCIGLAQQPVQPLK